MPTLPEEQKRWIGTWRNKRESTMRISSVSVISAPDTGQDHFKIDGTYQSKAGAVPDHVKFPLVGFTVFDQACFTVSYRYKAADNEVNSLTTWAGQILPLPENKSQEALQTLWHLVPNMKDGEHEEEYGWIIAYAGEDSFVKLSDDPDFSI